MILYRNRAPFPITTPWFKPICRARRWVGILAFGEVRAKRSQRRTAVARSRRARCNACALIRDNISARRRLRSWRGSMRAAAVVSSGSDAAYADARPLLPAPAAHGHPAESLRGECADPLSWEGHWLLAGHVHLSWNAHGEEHCCDSAWYSQAALALLALRLQLHQRAQTCQLDR